MEGASSRPEETHDEEKAMVIDRYRKCLESADYPGLGDVYSPDALRRQRAVSAAATPGCRRDQPSVRRWYEAGPPRFTTWQERPTDWGAVIEVEAVVGAGDDETRFREAHLLFCARDRIIEHIFYRTGPWDRATVGRHAAEAPMVRR
jgi:hypothetical protein